MECGSGLHGRSECLVTHISCQLNLLRLKITSVLSVSCEPFSPKFYLADCGRGCGWCGRCVCRVTHISKPITSAIYIDIRHRQEVSFLSYVFHGESFSSKFYLVECGCGWCGRSERTRVCKYLWPWAIFLQFYHWKYFAFSVHHDTF